MCLRKMLTKASSLGFAVRNNIIMTVEIIRFHFLSFNATSFSLNNDGIGKYIYVKQKKRCFHDNLVSYI